ncbi:hypothetical protein DFH08DRAFT_97670 [Mycena albidolilacea]|uniref:Uncharacterized protein n=1 Tax=Mycena albidolilacea TaxID=1033008 RepID=A0AAD7A872_9AGAR|nr:hypothetical protein DFH08DRAFT_97670 [Mycena albidolilacea]
MSKSPHLPATAFPAPDYDHPRYATPVRTPYTTWTVDPMRSVYVGVPRRPRRPRRLLSPRPSSASSAIDAYPYHAHHTQSRMHGTRRSRSPSRSTQSSPPPVPRATTLAARGLCLSCTNTTRTTNVLRHGGPCTPSSSPLHARLPSSVRSRSGYHHLMGVPGCIPSTMYTTNGVSSDRDRHSRLHMPLLSLRGRPHSPQRSSDARRAYLAVAPIRLDYLLLSWCLRQPFTIAHPAFVAHPLCPSLTHLARRLHHEWAAHMSRNPARARIEDVPECRSTSLPAHSTRTPSCAHRSPTDSTSGLSATSSRILSDDMHSPSNFDAFLYLPFPFSPFTSDQICRFALKYTCVCTLPLISSPNWSAYAFNPRERVVF